MVWFTGGLPDDVRSGVPVRVPHLGRTGSSSFESFLHWLSPVCQYIVETEANLYWRARAVIGHFAMKTFAVLAWKDCASLIGNLYHTSLYINYVSVCVKIFTATFFIVGKNGRSVERAITLLNDDQLRAYVLRVAREMRETRWITRMTARLVLVMGVVGKGKRIGIEVLQSNTHGEEVGHACAFTKEPLVIGMSILNNKS
ncbi:hypothetical protein HD553DRAFT_192496 [Filobasidium floriforme]|uniref:uncharacterized protein n=1 Tax=Filobasidium floriforme TaxID=5210 RepID=UPI001E8E8033|nr:uncharacterized protein HD553DRAFT_192496 [Filobasidium floriforme]KAH8088234.1 hypothetical protein HD553DRAFT_192496 [Filobasidium floriforme]